MRTSSLWLLQSYSMSIFNDLWWLLYHLHLKNPHKPASFRIWLYHCANVVYFYSQGRFSLMMYSFNLGQKPFTIRPLWTCLIVLKQLNCKLLSYLAIFYFTYVVNSEELRLGKWMEDTTCHLAKVLCFKIELYKLMRTEKIIWKEKVCRILSASSLLKLSSFVFRPLCRQRTQSQKCK